MAYTNKYNPLLSEGLQKLPFNENSITSEPTGFTNNSNITITYSASTRKVTLTGTFAAYWKGEVISVLTNGWVSEAHNDVVGRYYLYYNGSTFVWSTTIWTFDMVQIAGIIYTATSTPGPAVGWAIRETHGLVMDYRTHEAQHRLHGTYLVSGGTISDYVVASTIAANRRPLIAQTTVADEDLETIIAQLATESYTRVQLGTGLEPSFTQDSADIVNLSTNQPYYNSISGGNGAQTLMPSGNYQKIFVVAIPTTADAYSQKNRFVFWQGQVVSNNLSVIEAITWDSINKGTFGAAVQEYVPIGEIIIRYTGSNWELTSVNPITTERGSISITGMSGITSVAHDDTLTGSGTVTSPLSVVQTSTPIYKGDIAVNTDFPLIAEVAKYDSHVITASVTDNAGVTYTNTGQSFAAGDEIYWNGTSWSSVGSYGSWTSVSLTGIVRTSTSQFTVATQDWRDRVGYGLMINGLNPTNIITAVSYASGNSTVTTKGIPLPASFTTMKIADTTKMKVLTANYWHTTYNNVSTDIHTLSFNYFQELKHTGSKGRVVLVENRCFNVGTNTNAAKWNLTNGGLDVLSSDEALTTGTSDSGIKVQNNSVTYGSIVKATCEVATGVDDVQGGIVRVIIYEN